eukprot:6214756-Pleurochrysis_carterae.AAC.1
MTHEKGALKVEGKRGVIARILSDSYSFSFTLGERGTSVEEARRRVRIKLLSENGLCAAREDEPQLEKKRGSSNRRERIIMKKMLKMEKQRFNSNRLKALRNYVVLRTTPAIFPIVGASLKCAQQKHRRHHHKGVDDPPNLLVT